MLTVQQRIFSGPTQAMFSAAYCKDTVLSDLFEFRNLFVVLEELSSELAKD
jgi:hypothetical protein